MNASKSVTYCFDIINGPSKSVLFDSCKYVYDIYGMSPEIDMDFAISQEYLNHSNDATKLCQSPHITDIMVTGIQHEDGSGESFNLEGYCQTDIDYCLQKDNVHCFRYYRFSAYYNTGNRKGTFTLIAN